MYHKISGHDFLRKIRVTIENTCLHGKMSCKSDRDKQHVITNLDRVHQDLRALRKEIHSIDSPNVEALDVLDHHLSSMLHMIDCLHDKLRNMVGGGCEAFESTLHGACSGICKVYESLIERYIGFLESTPLDEHVKSTMVQRASKDLVICKRVSEVEDE